MRKFGGAMDQWNECDKVNFNSFHKPPLFNTAAKPQQPVTSVLAAAIT